MTEALPVVPLMGLVQRTAPMTVGMNPQQEFLCFKSNKLDRWFLLTVGEFISGKWKVI